MWAPATMTVHLFHVDTLIQSAIWNLPTQSLYPESTSRSSLGGRSIFSSHDRDCSTPLTYKPALNCQ